ncbi:hypothetical protein AAMO2058_000937800 [Amorphochlora amoebiformis]
MIPGRSYPNYQGQQGQFFHAPGAASGATGGFAPQGYGGHPHSVQQQQSGPPPQYGGFGPRPQQAPVGMGGPPIGAPPIVEAAPAEPPTDKEVQDRIDKMAEYYVRNGPRFEEMTIQKQGDNPLFSFLKGGPDYRYYRWKIYTRQANLSLDDVKNRLIIARSLRPPPNRAGPLPAEEEAKLQEAFNSLTGTKESIKATRKLITAITDTDQGTATRICSLALECTLNNVNFTDKLHLLYLLNDILHYYVKKRQDKTVIDAFAAALKPHLCEILASCTFGFSMPDVQKVHRVLNLWGSRSIYPKLTISILAALIRASGEEWAKQNNRPLPFSIGPGGPPNAPFPSPQGGPPGGGFPPAAGRGFGGPPAQGMQPQFQGGPPPGVPVGGGFPPPGVPPPMDSLMHLGPGLIVTLCKGRAPYMPLDPTEVPPSVPPAWDVPPDKVMVQKLDEFFREVHGEDRSERKRDSRRRRSPSSSRSPSRSRERRRRREDNRQRSRSRSSSRSRDRDRDRDRDRRSRSG